MRLAEIAARLSCELLGDPNVEIRRVIGIDEAGEGDLTFVANKKYLPKIKTTRASAIILSRDAPETAIPSLRTDNPYLAFAKAIELFYRPLEAPTGIHPTAVIAPSARLGKNARIGAHASIGEEAKIGDNVQIYPNVTIYPGVQIGDDCIIHSGAVIREQVRIANRVVIQNGAVIGSDGFGYVRQNDGTYYKIPQSGMVIIEDDVEIGANTTIDRAAVGATIIKRGVKIDNLVQIAHACVIGENTLIAAQAGLAGTTVVGRNVFLAGQVGAAGHLTIGDNVIATPQTGIPGSVEPGAVISGSPAIDHNLWLKVSAALPRLPELIRKVRQLERQIAKLIDQERQEGD